MKIPARISKNQKNIDNKNEKFICFIRMNIRLRAIQVGSLFKAHDRTTPTNADK